MFHEILSLWDAVIVLVSSDSSVCVAPRTSSIKFASTSKYKSSGPQTSYDLLDHKALNWISIQQTPSDDR
jgi:hypothetical protein